MKTEIFNSYTEFLNRNDKNINGVDRKFSEENPNYLEDNSSNEGCWNCRGCRDCQDCQSCNDCYSCRNCILCEGRTEETLEIETLRKWF